MIVRPQSEAGDAKMNTVSSITSHAEFKAMLGRPRNNYNTVKSVL